MTKNSEKDARRVKQKHVEIAQGVALLLLTLGSLPVFAVVAAPVESLFLSVLIGFGGWSVWCSIVIYATRGWVNDDD